MTKYLIGVDEAGRGPLAGPVAVGAVLVPVDFDWSLIPGVGDSKQLSEKKREEIYYRTRELAQSGEVHFAVAQVHATTIDRIGITKAVSLAMRRALLRLEADPTTTEVKLDGLLHAPEQFVHQETIIKGDSKELAIGLASIMAKVTRDRYMVRIAVQTAYRPYDFATHKGYGTKAHRQALKTHGLSSLHRQSYCRNI